MPLPVEPARRAIISDDGVYRYALVREGFSLKNSEAHGIPTRTVSFIMLNPSTADAKEDDPTIRRCMGFAAKWGYEKLVVGNLFAYRATKPTDLPDDLDEAIGPNNIEWLRHIVHESEMVVAAWGASKKAAARAEELNFTVPLYCLGTTKSGAPRHPLYVPGEQPPERFHA